MSARARALLVVVHLVGGGAPAIAQDGDPAAGLVEARARVAGGEALLERGDFDGALAEFERAYEVLGEHPSRHLILFNVARAHERSLRYDRALEYYARYLAEGGAAVEDRAEVEALVRTLEGLLGTLVVESAVAAEVWVDGRRVGEAPGSIRVPGGTHAVEVRAPGHVSERREVQLAPRTQLVLDLDLQPIPPPFEGLRPGFFLATAGLAVAAGAVGLGFAVRALHLRDEYRARLDDPVEGWRVGPQHEARLHDLSVRADVLFLTAGVLAVGATVLAFLSDFGGEPDVLVSAGVGPGGASLGIGGRL